jgi:hypothetical protein
VKLLKVEELDELVKAADAESDTSSDDEADELANWQNYVPMRHGHPHVTPTIFLQCVKDKCYCD